MRTEAPEALVDPVAAQISDLAGQLAALKAQVAALEAEVKRLRRQTQPETLGDLRGVLAGLPDFTAEEIDAALYRVDWDEPEDASE